MIAFLTSAAGRWAAVAVVALALASGLLWYRAEALSAQATVIQQADALAANAKALKDTRENAARNEAALTADADAQRQRATAIAATRKIIDATAPSTACMASPAIAAALLGLRRPAGDAVSSPAPGGAGGAARLPGSTAPTSR